MAKETKTPAVMDKPQPPTDNSPVNWESSGITGFENVHADDLGIPFLMILQSLSPEVKKTHKDYATKKIEGAEEGCVINTVTRQIVHRPGGDAITVVPLSYQRAFVEWKTRENGGGIVKVHTNGMILNEAKKNEKGQDILSNGNMIATTGYFNLMILGEEKTNAAIGMTSTQLKKARFWLNLMLGQRINGKSVPMFAFQYHLTTVPESNAKGSWFGWKITSGSVITDSKLAEQLIAESKRAQAPLLSAATDDNDTEVPYE
jgi:hypothetical protein